jgi:hypothetical protein
MVRVGLWGAFDADDVEGVLLPRIVRRELEARLPAAEMRVWTSGSNQGRWRFDGPRDEPPAPLGAWSGSRTDELAVASDVLVIAGPLDAADRFAVDGVGPAHEPDLPTAWHGVRLGAEPDPAFAAQLREACARRAHLSAGDPATAAWLRALTDREVVEVPGAAVLADRLLRADEPEDRTTRLRDRGLLPDDDVLVVWAGGPMPDAVVSQVGTICAERGLVPVVGAAPGFAGSLERLPNVHRLPDALDVADLLAVIAWSAGVVTTDPDLVLVAAAFGRPGVRVGEEPVGGVATTDPASVASTFATGGAIAREDVEAMRARLDAHFDALAALATGAAPVDPKERAIRSLTVRLAEQERTAADRERELEAMVAQLSRRLTETDVRFTTLWRKIREGDTHYNWQFNRAEAAEAELERLKDEVERLRATRVPPSRTAYLALRRGVGRVLRWLHLLPPLSEPPADA